ncbi:MAG: alpha/beta hydrolase [Chloroflexota bacterium]|nr:alpha/beta hydrolase [Chloroflexota bacterium]
MATFVLVHGGWHGGWCWKKVVPLVRAAGHTVFTPTLTGLGERAHLLTPAIDLTTHVRDILGVLEYEDLQRVILVGHSSSGMPLSDVADQAATRVAHLVYLDAFLQEPGKAVRDYADGVALDEEVRVHGDGWRLPLRWTLENLGVTDSADVAWMAPRLGDHPYKAMTQPVQVTPDRLHSLQRTYIQTTPGFAQHAERAKRWGFGYYELLSGGHDVMVTKPAELVKIFLELV